jgi:hypothetical protein
MACDECKNAGWEFFHEQGKVSYWGYDNATKEQKAAIETTIHKESWDLLQKPAQDSVIVPEGEDYSTYDHFARLVTKIRAFVNNNGGEF